MKTVSSFLRKSAAVALLAASAAGSAHAVDISVGSYANSGMGAEFATAFDTFTLTGQSTTVAPSSSPTAITLGTYVFEVGPNCSACTLTPSFTGLLDVTVDGLTQQFALPYSWYSDGPNDFLSFTAPAPLMFDFGTYGLVTVAMDSIGLLTSPIGTVGGNVYGTVTVTPVPEPGTYALMLAGIAAVSLVARRRRA